MISDDLRNSKGMNEAEFLKAYKPGNYARPSVTVDTLVFTMGQQKADNYRRLPEKKPGYPDDQTGRPSLYRTVGNSGGLRQHG